MTLILELPDNKEAGLKARGIQPGAASLEEMEALWQDAKKAEKSA